MFRQRFSTNLAHRGAGSVPVQTGGSLCAEEDLTKKKKKKKTGLIPWDEVQRDGH